MLGENGNLQRANCHGEKGVHCEMRMLELICRELASGSVSVNVLKVLAQAIKDKNFTISKFCCWWCHEVFSALENVAKNNNLDFQSKLLGNSCAFFPGWKSPSFASNELFDILHIENSLDLIKEDNLLISIDKLNIENSEVIALYKSFSLQVSTEEILI